MGSGAPFEVVTTSHEALFASKILVPRDSTSIDG